MGTTFFDLPVEVRKRVWRLFHADRIAIHIKNNSHKCHQESWYCEVKKSFGLCVDKTMQIKRITWLDDALPARMSWYCSVWVDIPMRVVLHVRQDETVHVAISFFHFCEHCNDDRPHSRFFEFSRYEKIL
jgi:hypothetical protein